MPPELATRAHLWHLLARLGEARLGRDEWLSISGPDADLAQDHEVPLAPLLRAIERLEAGGWEHPRAALARAYVAEWRERYAVLVGQIYGRADRAIDLACRVVVPYLFPGSPSAEFRETSDGRGLVEPPAGLPVGFIKGIIEGFVETAGARVEIRAADTGPLELAWATPRVASPTAAPTILANAMRTPFFPATLISVLIGAAIAYHDFATGRVAGRFHWPHLGLTLTGVVLFQLATNTLNDYFHRRTDRADEAPRAPPPQLLAMSLILYAAGTLIGLYLVAALWPQGLTIFWLGLAGFLLGFLYTAPPARLSHHGVGELAVAVGFGPLIVLGAYFTQTLSFSPGAFLASLPVGFLIAAVLYINEFPDKDGDARIGKRTLIVRLPARAAVLGYHVLLTLCYLTILAGVIADWFPVFTLAALLTVPLAIKASLLLNRFYQVPYRLVPANAFTILLHFTTGLLFFAGYVAAILLG